MDRVSNFLTQSPDFILAIDTASLEACEAELSALNDGPYMFEAMESVGEKARAAWDAIKRVVKKIIEWFKALPGRVANFAKGLWAFLTKRSNEVEVPADVAAKMETLDKQITAKVEHLETMSAQLEKLNDKLDAILDSNPYSDEIDELENQIDTIEATYDRIKKEVATLSEELQNLRTQYIDNPEKSSGQKKRINVAAFKAKAQSLLQRINRAAPKFSRSSDHLGQKINQAENEGNRADETGDGVRDKAPQRWGRITRLKSRIGRLFGAIPGTLKQCASSVFSRSGSSTSAEPTPEGNG